MIIGVERKVLLYRIKVKRIVMYKKAGRFGFTHPDVVKCSQQLDTLLNKAQGICA